MCTLFKDWRVEPVPNEGETMNAARERTLECVKDNAMVLLLQMVKPEQVGVRWVRKEARRG